MSNFKENFKKIFEFKPQITYSFSLPNMSDMKETEEPKPDNNSSKKSQNIFSSVQVNTEYIKSKYNTMINSDIITREFVLNSRGKQYNALILYIDGMIDSNLLNDFVLKPLMMRNGNNLFDGNQNRVISEAVTNNITVRKVKKFDLSNYIESCLIPQNSIKKVKTFDEIFDGVNSGDCGLFIDTLEIAFDIDVKGFKQRGIEKPQNEIVIKGSHESFTENIRTNTSLLRRFSNSKDLIIENVSVGNLTKTKCAVCYIKTIANSDLVAEVKYRMNNLNVDYLLSSGQLEQLICDSNILRLAQSDFNRKA